jgi:predicted nucleic acid-binding protein
VSSLIVADAGPLIGLGRVGLLPLLRDLYTSVLIPSRVLKELRISSEMPGARALSAALQEGWLVHLAVDPTPELKKLLEMLDPGEAEAILLARQRTTPILIDERHGRAVARDLGLSVVGTGSVLLQAKEKGFLDRVDAAIERLTDAGYRLSPELKQQLLEQAGEA